MARTNIDKRHCQCRAKCTTKTGSRKCKATCTHADRFSVRRRMTDEQAQHHGKTPNKNGQYSWWFGSYGEAEEFLARLAAEVGNGVEARRFDEVAESWLATTAIDTKPSTVTKYERDLRNHLIPVLGDRVVTSISQDEVQGLVNGWSATAAPQTVRNRTNVLIPVLRHGGNTIPVGKDKGGIVLPAQRRPGNDPKVTARLFLESTEELRQLVQRMPARYRLFTTFLAIVGCRPGEALGLRQSDIINGQRLQISRHIDRPSSSPDRYRESDSTKTGEARIVWCPPGLLDELRDETAPRDTLLFSEDGTYLNYSKFGKAFKRARRDALPARLARLRPYDLRHTAASLLANRGASILVVAGQLGHSDPSVTAKTYAHLFPSVTDTLIGKLDADVETVMAG